jgi:hypothetical protein
MEKQNASEGDKNITEARYGNGHTQIDFGEDGRPDDKG